MREVLLFVYGSLKRGFVHHDKLAGALFSSEVQTVPGFSLFLYEGYPALVAKGKGVVSGELFVVNHAMLVALDDFEDAPDLYERRKLQISDGRSAFAYVMVPNRVAGCPRIPYGCWTLTWQARTFGG